MSVAANDGNRRGNKRVRKTNRRKTLISATTAKAKAGRAGARGKRVGGHGRASAAKASVTKSRGGRRPRRTPRPAQS